MLRRVGIGAHEELADVGDLAERAPDLLAVEHVVVAVAHRRGCAATRGRSPRPARRSPGTTPRRRAGSSGRCSAFCSSVPSSMSVGPACSVPTKFTPTYGARGPGRLLEEDQLLGRRRAPAAVLRRPVQAGVAGVEQAALPVGVPLAARGPRVARRLRRERRQRRARATRAARRGTPRRPRSSAAPQGGSLRGDSAVTDGSGARS